MDLAFATDGSRSRMEMDASKDGILSELESWKTLSKTGADIEERRQGSVFSRAIESVVQEIKALDSTTLDELEDSAHSILGLVDDLWRLEEYQYPEDRMNQFLTVTSFIFAEAISNNLKANLFGKNTNEIHSVLLKGLAACDAWINESIRMVSLFWKNDVRHPWKGEPYQSIVIVRLRDRISQLSSILQATELASQLLSSLGVEQMAPGFFLQNFQVLEKDSTRDGLLDNSAWDDVMSAFNQHFSSIEKDIVRALRPLIISAAKSDTAVLLDAFLSYKELMQRPGVRSELESEGHMLVSRARSWLKNLSSALEEIKTKKISDSFSDVQDLPQRLSTMRQLEDQVTSIQRGIKMFNTNVMETKNLEVEAQALLLDIQDQTTEIFDSWSRNVLSGIRDRSLRLQSDTPVITFDQNKLMRINYDTKLARFVEEVHSLSSMGFKLAPEILKNSKIAQEFTKQAEVLQEIAVFHNNIGGSILPYLKPLMLEAAVVLSTIVQEQVTWDSAEVNDYIRRLQAAVHRLAALNQQLNHCNTQIQAKVVRLFNTALVKQPQKWKDTLKEIRLIFGTVEAQGYHHLHAWRIYWDYQLYKALENQYERQSIEFQTNDSDIYIELDFKKQNLIFKPPIEDIRRDYYARFRKFLSVPVHFKGVADTIPGSPNIFPMIVQKHARFFDHLYASSGRLFTELMQFREQYKRWIASAVVDLDALFTHDLKEPEDWNTAFQVIKVKREEILTLFSDDERVGCFVVGLAPLQREVEYLISRYWDSLVMSLYASINDDAVEIETFMANGISFLEAQSENMHKLPLTDGNELIQNVTEMGKLLKRAECKSQVMQRWNQEYVDRLSDVRVKWKSFEMVLSRYKDAISQELNNLKTGSQSQIALFTARLDSFNQQWQNQRLSLSNLPEMDRRSINESIKKLANLRIEWDELMNQKTEMNSSLMRIGEDPVEFSLATDIEADIAHHELICGFYMSFITGLEEIGEEEWLVFRNKIGKLDQFLENWNEKLQEHRDTHPLLKWLETEIGSYKSYIPLMKLARGEIFASYHWIEFLTLAELPRMLENQILVRHVMQCRGILLRKTTELKELNSRAAKESLVRQAIAELEQWERGSKWNLIQHSDSMGNQLYIVKEFKELLNKVGDNLGLIQSIKDLPHHQNYSDSIIMWESKMMDLDVYIRQLNQIQMKWLYLEPVFNRGALLKEAGRFRRLDADFRFIIAEMKRDSLVSSILRVPNLRSLISNILDQVGRCQKSLFEFLEEKRSKFARFYFLGDEDLLDILGQAANRPSVVQTHLKKLFAGIDSVIFSDDHRQIVAIASLEGEEVKLNRPVTVMGQEVEIWLNQLVTETRSTLKTMMRECIQERRRNAADIVSRFPSQILCLSESVIFTESCEKAISSSSDELNRLKNEYQDQLAKHTSAAALKPSSGSNPNPVFVLKLQSLIMDIIHYIDVIEQLVAARCCLIHSWTWQKQLRFYVTNDVAVARMATTEIPITFEYQGNVAKLVHTALTDKCYLTLTLALQMGLGGNPYGPAGTGKTESVKALGALLGRQVLVFNCDEGLDVKSLGRIFVGLAQSGAWGCFDEFNRLDEDTLSTVATLVEAIQQALKNKDEKVNLLGSQTDINPDAGIFITLNPAGKEYGGRQKLPDNLKLLFRPVVMAEPDIELIAEVILCSQGFRNAKSIAKKLSEIFHLAQKLLSRQQHYDWGLRALKSVLRTAGDELAKQNLTDVALDVDSVEYSAAVRALNFNTLSKLTTADSAVFLGLIADMFPMAKHLHDSEHAKLLEIIAECCSEMGLAFIDQQAKKVLQVYEQTKQRMGVVVVGPPQTGKSTVCRILKMVLQKQKTHIQVFEMNPKAISRIQLLGAIDSTTREWTDGTLTKIARSVASENDSTSWIICDGDIDPEWIEALNSVLDDNRLLTMASGERIKFGPKVNFMFETHDLTYASPATISRMGVVFFSQNDVEYKTVIQRWLQQQPIKRQEVLALMMDAYFYKAIDWLTVNGEVVIPVSFWTVIRGILYHLPFSENKTDFICGLLRGGCANLTPMARRSFREMLLTLSDEKSIDLDNPHFRNNHTTEFPVAMDSKDVELFNRSPENVNASRLLVPTSNLRAAYNTIYPWLSQKAHVMLVGPEACGISLLVEYCFRQARSVRMVKVNCTCVTSPNDVLQKIFQNAIIVSSSKGQLLCPREASLLVLHIMDLNVIMPDKWGTCQLVAFLEQIINFKGCYDANGEWLIMDCIQIVCSINLTRVQGRFELSHRFNSLLQIAVISELQLQELELLSSTYLKAALEKQNVHPTQQVLSELTSFMASFHEKILSNVAHDSNFGTGFTTRDLVDWSSGIARYEVEWRDLGSDVIQALNYEATRIYRDRFGSEKQKVNFDGISNQLFNEKWSVGLQSAKGFIFTVNRQHPQKLVRTKVTDWGLVMQRTLQQYGRESEPMDIELLPELLQTLAHCDRVLCSASNRSLVLVGRSGVGRHTAIKILSMLHNARVITPYPVKNNGKKQLINDLKMAVQAAGTDGDLVYLAVENHSFWNHELYAAMDSLLSSGEVPGMFSSEEMEAILNPMKEIAAQQGYSGSLFSFYADRVKRNLRVAFIVDCSQPAFETLLETHPAFYKYSDRLWMENWSSSSMITVAAKIVNRMGEAAVAELKHSVEIFESLDSTLKCPRRYISFVHTYFNLVNKKTLELAERHQRIQRGVNKLSEARELVTRLQTEASKQEQLLEQKQMEAKAALQKITDTIQNASVRRGEMQDLRNTIAHENKTLTERKEAIDKELAEIEPLLLEARSSVSEIRNESLAEIRSLRAPPEVIRDILEGVLRLMGIQDTSWTSMKSFLAKRGVKEEIRSFDARRITTESRHAVELLLTRRKESFEAKVARRASAAAAPLAAWVQANVAYSRVLERISPLEQEQANLRKNLQAAEDNMARLSNGLSDVDKQVIQLREELSVSTRQATETQIGLDSARKTLHASQTLILELADEYNRWRTQLEQMQKDRRRVAGHALVAAASISFLSCATEDQKKKFLSSWVKLIQLKGQTEDEGEDSHTSFSLKKYLTNEQELILWRSEGLPSDDWTVENAIAILVSNLHPYILDSSGQTIKWITTHFRGSTLEVISQADERFIYVLDLSIRFGKTLLVRDVEEIDPVLYPVLRKDYIIEGVRKLVPLGGKLVDVNDNFRLFLFSRSARTVMQVEHHTNALVNTINMNTTVAGLAEQLVALTIRHENPELDQRKELLLKQEEELKLQLAELEEKLLNILGSSQGNILENQDVLASLKQLKQSSSTISLSLKESLELQLCLEKERVAYKELSQFASRLYFAIQKLSKLNPCYQFSVSSFMQIYLRNLSVKRLTKSDKPNIIQHRLLEAVYTTVSHALFQSDKMPAALHIIQEMKPDVFQTNEWEVFVGLKSGRNSSSKFQLPTWIADIQSPNVYAIKAYLPSLFSAIRLEDENLWTSSNINSTIPSPIKRELTPFQEVLVFQALYPDRTIDALAAFISHVLNMTELFPTIPSLRAILDETSPLEPVLVLLPVEGSGGYDMTSELREIAKSVLEPESLLHEIAMGTKETTWAMEKVLKAAEKGHWVCLRNVHLVTSWLPDLERMLDECAQNGLHTNFRLWMTAEPVANIPVSLLERSKKIVSEVPHGIKRTIMKTLETWNVGPVTESAVQTQARFLLAWFHAIVQERRNYTPQGWLKRYDFNEADLRAADQLLVKVTSLFEDPANRWECLRGLLLNAIYGGRVDNKFDFRILNSYLSQFFCSATIGKVSNIAHEVVVPLSTKFQDYAACIGDLPESNNSLYVGLPANVDATIHYNEALHLSSRLRELHQVPFKSNEGDSSSLLLKLHPIFALWKSLLQGKTRLLTSDVQQLTSTGGAKTSPLTAFIEVESTFALRLVQTVHQSLLVMNRSLKSNSSLPIDLLELALEICCLKTPKPWLSVWDGPTRIEPYLRSLVKKAQALKSNWLPNALKNQLLSNTLDISELMSPEAFIGVLRQQTARELEMPIESLKLSTIWDGISIARSQTQLKVVAFLSGIYIQGATMKLGNGLEECNAETPSWSSVPTCSVSWIPDDKEFFSCKQELNKIQVPLYLDEERQRLISVLEIPFRNGDCETWFRTGVALCLKA